MSELELILEKLAGIEGRLAALEGGVLPGPVGGDIVSLWVEAAEAFSQGPGDVGAFLNCIAYVDADISDILGFALGDVEGDLAELPYNEFFGVVYNYLLAEEGEEGDSAGVTRFELYEAVAYGLDRVLRVGPARTEYRSEDGRLSVAHLFGPVALLLRQIAAWSGEGRGMGEDGREIIVPTDPPAGGWPWSMPGQ
jgi:hypothetical protein